MIGLTIDQDDKNKLNEKLSTIEKLQFTWESTFKLAEHYLERLAGKLNLNYFEIPIEFWDLHIKNYRQNWIILPIRYIFVCKSLDSDHNLLFPPDLVIPKLLLGIKFRA